MKSFNFFKLLLLLPLLIHSKDSIFSFPSFNFTWNLDLNLNKYISQLKSSTPEFIKDMQKSMSEFLKKTEKEKDKYLESLSNIAQEKYDQIKSGMKKGVKSVQKETKELIEKMTETANALSYKVCDMVKKGYEQCNNNKKKIYLDLIDKVKENFGECSVIINEINNLSENKELNLKYFLFLIISLTENPDIIEKGTSQILYDIINCLQEKFEIIWPSINSTIVNDIMKINTKQDIISLLAKSISNFGIFIQFEEKYGFIEKAEKITGLIKDIKAKTVYKNIFNILKDFNEFGTQSFNISTNLNLNVFTQDNNISDYTNKIIDHKEKGIKIKLNLEYMLKDLKAHSVQAVVFESPLVSLRAKKETQSGVANTFVGITLYNKEGKEIFVSDIQLSNLRPIILFKKKLYKAMKICLYYNEEKNIMETEGIDTQTEEFDGEEYIKCIPKHFSSFTIGNFDVENIKQKTGEKNGVKYGLFKGIIVIIALFSCFYLYRCYRQKRVEDINRHFNEL